MVNRKTMRRCGGGGRRRERGNLLMRCCGEVTRLGSETLRQYTTAPQHCSALQRLTLTGPTALHCAVVSPQLVLVLAPVNMSQDSQQFWKEYESLVSLNTEQASTIAPWIFKEQVDIAPSSSTTYEHVISTIQSYNEKYIEQQSKHQPILIRSKYYNKIC